MILKRAKDRSFLLIVKLVLKQKILRKKESKTMKNYNNKQTISKKYIKQYKKW